MGETITTLSKDATARQMLDYYLAKCYSDAREGKARGELVCWATSIAPCEFNETMGIHTLYPENHAAAVAARHGAMDLLNHADSVGYSLDNCAYARINLAYKDVQQCVTEEMPLPDFVLVTNNICETVMKWYENLSYDLNIPIITIDAPFNHTYEPTEWTIDYIAAQFESYIKQLEEICGRPFDYDKFHEVLNIAEENSYWWTEAMGKAALEPCPMNGFDMFNYMALIVCMRGKKGCGDTFKKLAEELEEKHAQGISDFPAEEHYRIMWDGIAVWPYVGFTYKTMKNMGMNMTASTYPKGWELKYDKNDIRSMARAYGIIMNNNNLPCKADYFASVIKKYNCKGATYHLNRSCKIMCFTNHELQKLAGEMTGTPYIMFDGDQADPKNFSKAQFETRIQGLAETMDARREAAE
ncbi:MAG: 2-hydroxyacyl-CoA dehydratase [Lachnospiraceae bacterium]|nr:2-hydroxyacyl-CoA dehydratase [Lachnospiraceae bacterium]